MRRDGRLTPVREDSSSNSSSVRYRLPIGRNKKQPEGPGDVGPAATSHNTRTGVSNDHVTLPAIKPANQQSNQRHGLSPNINSSQVQQTPAAPGSLGPKQPGDTLFPAGRQHKAAAGPGMEHHMLASHLLHATNTQSRAGTSSRRASSSSHVSSRPRTQQQRDETEDEVIHAQQQLQQLYGNSSTCSPEREAAAGGRILALPFAICTAADGSLYEVATGHVQLMMLRRQLAVAGINLTDEEAALLTSRANLACSGRPRALRPHVTEGATQTAGSSSSGADAALPAHDNGNGPSSRGSTTDDGAAAGRMRKSVLSEGGRGSSQAGGGDGGHAAGRRGSLVGMGPARRRSALGAALEVHAGGDSMAVDPKEQLPLDDVVLSHLAQLDAFAANLRQRLADQAAAARAAKAQAVAAAAELAAGRNHCGSGRRSWHVTPRSQYLQQQQQQQQQQQAAQGEGAEADATQAVPKPTRSAARQWGAARGLVMLNIANWQKQQVRSSRMQAAPTVKPPTWEDVILLGDVYIKRRSGQGAAVYEARCAELGITACTQVLQQLECEHANMAHCNLGAGAAPALGAALSANRSISSLDLRDNNLDGRAVSHIFKGIFTATAAHLPASAKQRNISFSHRSVVAIGANRQAEGLPAARPSAPPPRGEEQWSLLQAGGTPALLVRLSGGGSSSGANHHQQQQQQSSMAGSSIKKSKSLAVRWGEDSSSSCNGADGLLSSGVDMAAAATAAAAAAGGGGRGGGSSLGGSRTVPSSPSKASAAAAAAVRLPYAWDENGEDCVPSDQQPQQQQQQQSVSGFGGSVSAAGGSLQGQISCGSIRSVAGSMLSSNDAARDAADAEIFLPDTTAAHAWAGQCGTSCSSSGSSSFGRGSGSSSSAGEVLPSPVASASASGSGSASGRLVSWDSPAAGCRAAAAAAAAAARDVDAEEASCCGTDTAGACRQQQQQQQLQGSVAGCGSGCEPVIYSLLSGLDLSENPLGLAGGKAVAQLLDPSVHPSQFLVRLNLSKCNLGEAGGLAVAAALQAGNLELRVLLLSHNNLGNKTASAFGDLLESSHTLKELDLSWNQIKAEGGRALAKGLAANATLAKLSLAWNGLEEGACAMGDMLAANMGLKHLDLSHCRVGAEACMMLGEGLKGNVMLEVLLLSGNDRIGEDGARHLMVALAANRSLHFLGLNGSNMTSAVHEAGGGASEFNPAAPDGSYSLDLAVAPDRVVAVQLVELDRAAEKELLRGISVDGKVIPSARKANWPAMLPSRGLLSCTFSSTSVRKALGVMEGSKLTTLLKQLRLSGMSDRERLEMVAMFAPFALFTCRQISSVTQTFSIGAERIAAVALLFTRAADAATDLPSLTCKMSSYDRVGWREVLGWYSTYRWNAPTGHYELDLGLPVHAAIAARLRDESNDSPEGPTWLNLLYDCATTCMKKPQSHGPPEDWKAGIPTRGSVSLDYVSTHPPGSKQTHTTWGLPPLPTAGSGTGARSRRSSANGTARPSANGAAAAAKAAAASSARLRAVGAAAAAAAGGQQQGPASGSGASSSSSAAAAAAEEPLKLISDQQLEDLMRKQMGLQGAAPPPPLPPAAATDGTTAAAAAAGVAAADAAVTALRQAVASGLLLLSAQVRKLVEALTLSPHRVEVAVLCWPITLDRDENYWTVLYALQGIEQSNLLQRLGPSRLFNPAHASCHWVLDLAHPAHEEVAKKLVALASSSGSSSSSSSSSKAKDKGDEGTLQNWWNLRLRGVQKQVNENGNNMWGALTAEDFQPILEFDFLGPDSWAAGGRSEAEVAAMGVADKMELRARQAARLEAVRLKQLYPYSCDGSGFPRQPWATYESLMSPQLLKTPWTAAWDRLVRVLLRLEHRSGASSKHSSLLQQAFEAAAVASEQMCVVVPQRPAALAAAATAAQAAASAEETAAAAAVAGGGSNEGSRRNSAVAQQQAAAVAEAPAAVAAAAVVPGSSQAEGQEPQLCITAREFEVLLKSWGYNKAEVSQYLSLMEALLQAEQDTQQAAAAKAAAAANAAAAAAAATAGGAGGSSLSAAAPAAAACDSSSGGSSVQPSRSSTPTQQAAASSGGAGGKAAKGKAGCAAGGAAVRAGVRVQALAGGKAKPAGGGGLGCSADGGAASFAAQLEARFERGLTFSEFVGVVMTEPRASGRRRDVAKLATILQGGGTAGAKGLKLASAAAAAAESAADRTDVQAAPAKSEAE